ncbi:MAG: alpha/beta fold hydrolase [Wenzhouxiangellaceae bacterium]
MPHDQPVVEVQCRDNHRFELIDIAPEYPERNMLLLPGMGISARHYIGFAQQLARAGTRVFIHEWRGNGSSSLRAGNGRDWGYRALIESDLDAAIDTIAQLHRRPIWLAGHSLGAQLACLAAARRPENAAGLVLVAGGSPYARIFPWPMRLVLAIVLRAFPLLSGWVGHFPGKRLGFAGTEAHGVMADWSRTARTGRYDLATLDFDAEASLAGLELPLRAVRMQCDRFVPEASMDWLLNKMPRCDAERRTITSQAQGTRADHYRWLEHPETSAETVADWLRNF